MRCKKSVATIAATVIGSNVMLGCTTVPPHDGIAAVRVNDVIKLVKCDIAREVFKKIGQSDGGKYPFAFLSQWAAKIHMTLVVDDTNIINPGLTLTEPLKAIKPATQTFSLGIGGGLTTEAVRTEDLEFLVSFSDMMAEFRKPNTKEITYGGCPRSTGDFLESDLDLEGLVDSALEPVEHGILTPGHDVGPGVTAIPQQPLGNLVQLADNARKAEPPLKFNVAEQVSVNELANSPASQNFVEKFATQNQDKGNIRELFAKQGDTANAIVNDLRSLLHYRGRATELETRTQSIINNIVKPLYAIASSSCDPKHLDDVTKSQFAAITYSADVSLLVVDIDQSKIPDEAHTYLKKLVDNLNKTIDETRSMATAITKCPPPPKKPQPIYDPVDVISETVNFYVTLSGSVTPTWKLVRVTTPNAGTFFSVSRKDTNTLILAMGRPQTTADGTVAAASQAMNNQILSAILSQAIRNSPVLPQ